MMQFTKCMESQRMNMYFDRKELDLEMSYVWVLFNIILSFSLAFHCGYLSASLPPKYCISLFSTIWATCLDNHKLIGLSFWWDCTGWATTVLDPDLRNPWQMFLSCDSSTWLHRYDYVVQIHHMLPWCYFPPLLVHPLMSRSEEHILRYSSRLEDINDIRTTSKTVKWTC
jgi:hypothetical protein